MNKLLALLLSILPFCIFINRGINKVAILLVIFLVLRVLWNNKLMIFPLSALLGIIISNYKLAEQYFNLGLKSLDSINTMQYGMRLFEFIIMLYAFSNKRIIEDIYKNFIKYKKIILIEIIIAQILSVYLLITGIGFTNMWGMHNFVGFYDTPHPYGYSLIVMSVLIELLIRENNDKKLLILYIVPFVTALLTGARTPMVAMVAIVIIFRMFKIRFIKIPKKIKIKTLLIISVGILFCIIGGSSILEFILKSNIMDKFISTSNNGTFDNGRTIYWSNILKYFFTHFNIQEQLFGHGIFYTVVINKVTVGLEIWAHSDFVDIIVSYGLIALFIYLFFYINYFYKLGKNLKYRGVALSLLIIFTFLSSGNGTINYDGFIPSVIYIAILLYGNSSCLKVRTDKNIADKVYSN